RIRRAAGAEDRLRRPARELGATEGGRRNGGHVFPARHGLRADAAPLAEGTVRRVALELMTEDPLRPRLEVEGLSRRDRRRELGFQRNGAAHARRAYGRLDRKSTRLNSSHVAISYAVFCL